MIQHMWKLQVREQVRPLGKHSSVNRRAVDFYESIITDFSLLSLIPSLFVLAPLYISKCFILGKSGRGGGGGRKEGRREEKDHVIIFCWKKCEREDLSMCYQTIMIFNVQYSDGILLPARLIAWKSAKRYKQLLQIQLSNFSWVDSNQM